jgi:hypothetical protein
MVETAIVLTLFWLGTVVGYVHSQQGIFQQMKPNELGDFIAGTFSPLAFSWFLITVLFQRREIHERVTQREVQSLQEQVNTAIRHLASCIRFLAHKSGDLMISVPGRGVRSNIFGSVEEYEESIDQDDMKFLIESFLENIDKLNTDIKQVDFRFSKFNDRIMRATKDELTRVRKASGQVIMLTRTSAVGIDFAVPVASIEMLDAKAISVSSALNSYVETAQTEDNE